jgi:hypothetical protein
MLNDDPEIKAIEDIHKILEPFDSEVRARVLKWVISKFKISHETIEDDRVLATDKSLTLKNDASNYSDLADKDGDGIRLIATDLKAKNRTDMALRVAYLFVFLRKSLLGQEETAKKEIYDAIRNYGAYDNNTPFALSGQRLLINKGEVIKITKPAEKQALKIIEEIRNPQIETTWNPNKKSSKKLKTVRKNASKN